jgi:hypothetical protein
MTFDEKVEYVKRNKKIDINKFDSVKEVTNIVDFINNDVKRKRDEEAGAEIHEISKFLVNMMNRKTFILKGKNETVSNNTLIQRSPIA